MARLVAEALNHVAVAAGKVPDVAGAEVVDAGMSLRIDDRGTHPSVDHEGPLGGGRVPVKLPHHPRLETHRHPGDPLRDRQLLDRGLLAVAAAEDAPLRLLQGEGELRKRLLGEERIGDVVHEGGVTGDAWPPSGHESRGARERRHAGEEVATVGGLSRGPAIGGCHGGSLSRFWE